MKTVQFKSFGGPNVLEMADWPIPRPGPGQVAIDVRYAGVNYAEVMQRKGLFPATPLPSVPGLEVAGVVAEIGPGVSGFALGEPVAAFAQAPAKALGGYAERTVVDARLAISLRRDARQLSFEEGAGFPCAAVTAYQLLSDVARLRRGETVLIQSAAGGVGSLVAQYARALGAGRIVGVVGSEGKCKAALDAGCDVALVRDEFVEKAIKLTDGRGFDVVLESVGGDNLARSLAVLAPMGRIAFFGDTSGSGPIMIPAFDLWFGAKGIIGYNIGGLAAGAPDRWQTAARGAIGLIASGAVRLAPSRILRLDEAHEAHAALEGRASTGKLILQVAA